MTTIDIRAGATSNIWYVFAAAIAFCMLSSGTPHAQETAPQTPTEKPWTIPSDAAIRELLSERMQLNGVGVVVGIIEPAGRRIVTYGRRGAGDARPLDGDTIFQIGSLTKTFTTLLLAEMVQRGEVKLDDPASMYLPSGVRMPERGRPLTLRDLATHMSGLPSMPTNYVLDAEPDPYEAYSAEQLHAFLSAYTLPREPGTKYQYSNLGVALLGRLLADRAGKDYESLLRERVLRPLDMRSTAITLTADQARRLAPGHDRYLRPVHSWEMATLPASGSLRSSMNDMLTFVAAYLGYESTPLQTAMAQQLAVRVPVGGSVQHLGWGTRGAGAMEVVGHDGGKAGYRSAAMFNRANRTGVVVLANARTDDPPSSIAVHLLTGRPLQPAPAAPQRREIKLDRKVLDAYAGQYRIDGDSVLFVARKRDHLLVHTPGNGIVEFHADGERDFFMNTGNDDISFEVDGEGRATGVLWYGSGRDAGESRRALRER